MSIGYLLIAAALTLVYSASILLASFAGQRNGSGVIAFVSNRTGYYEIFLLDVGTGYTRKLLDRDQTIFDQFDPHWSPDGQRIAFTANLPNTDSHINSAYNREVFVVAITGRNLTNLTQNISDRETLAGWSPDGQSILFASNRNWALGAYGTREFTNIFTSNVGNGAVQQVGEFELLFQHPEWSPDGTQILFSAPAHLKYPDAVSNSVDQDYEIFVTDSDGSNLRWLTDNTVDDGMPVWSPDGSQIAFMSPLVEEAGIFVMDSDGSNLRQLTSGYLGTGLNEPKSLVWSSNGRYLATVFYLGGSPDIYIIDVQTGDLHNLSNNPARDHQPGWSFDGRQIAFTSNRVGSQDIYVMDIDGGNVRNLTNNPADDYSPVWWPGLR